METTFSKSSATDATLKIEIKAQDYQPELNKKIKEYCKTATVKGFRRGFVPEGYIRKLYGKSLMVDTVINQVSKGVNDYIKENNLRVVGDPLPNEEAYSLDWDRDTDFTFEYKVGLASDFEVDFDKLPALENLSIEPGEEQINVAIEDIKARYGVDSEPEECEIGDILFGTLRQAETEFEKSSGIPTDKVLPDAQKLFVGLEKGSKVSFDIQKLFGSLRELGFATGKSDEDAGELSGTFEFEVNSITRKVPAELGQELYDKAFGPGKVNNEEEFKAEIVKVIKDNYNRESQYLLDFDVEKNLLDNVKIDLPEAFLKEWLSKVEDGKYTPDVIENEYEAFARGLRLDLIKNEIAKNNEIKVSYDDVLNEVKAEIANYFGGQGYQGMEDFIHQMAERQLKENKDGAYRRYFDKAFGRVVTNFAKEKMKIKDKSVKLEEFNEIAKAKYEVA